MNDWNEWTYEMMNGEFNVGVSEWMNEWMNCLIDWLINQFVVRWVNEDKDRWMKWGINELMNYGRILIKYSNDVWMDE